jgi:hypothetical protein
MGARMAKAILSKIPQIPVEKMIALPIEDLLELAKEAKEALVEAKGQKDWIDGVITLKTLVSDKNNNNSDNNNNFGGQNEQTTNY